MEVIKMSYYRTPAGDMAIGSYGDKICICDWVAGKRRNETQRRVCRSLGAECVDGTSRVVEETIRQLDEYFAGERKVFKVPMVFTGTPFQCGVWAELMRIPYGETVSYAELARRIGQPRAVRAVAGANACNPMSVLVPCHRVTGSNNRLGGYGGGLDAKRLLLALEAGVCGQALPL